ncbi:hypothetical protein C5D07_13305 [Rathayibacter tritici]|uniref:hypothetical protein n=1 Tax=Rathayibacter tritici TaxID=33888 RepID=UPI000CE7857F|nr:hypothetical protein [Rathayibacter tritici]PPF29988.1 hypothetical protein C5C06_05800 [Rathayibacter tritici]PPI11965.1 hypothetical protein C5D07_13305 [Rathayibacter tritici]
MQDQHDQDPLERSRTAERHWGPADSLLPRLDRQRALLAAADALADGTSHVWSRLLRDYTRTSDRVVSVHGDAEAATLGWLKPRGVVSLLVTERCDDDTAAEHLVAALAAMNAVTLTVDDARATRLRPLLDVLHQHLPDAFAELAVDRRAPYPAGAAVAVLAPGTFYRAWAPPLALAPVHDDDDRLALLTLYGRVRQLDVRPS